MLYHAIISTKELHQKIKSKTICFGGNKQLKIYGTLHCRSGKRLTKANRVFFSSEEEAIQQQYRPCGHCMKTAYKKWKDGLI
jgi:methylphosphotriester-DNA--protein-cysteine methyltransferase